MPVPTTSKPRPTRNVVYEGMASEMWPNMMMMPPMRTALRWPRKRSAIQPPGRLIR